MAKKEITDAHEALDVNIDASTRTIKAQFRRKARDLESQRAAGIPASKKTFEELNEAYRALISGRHKDQALPTKTVTILSSDVAGYSRMMAKNEQETLEFFHFCKEVFEEIVADNHGRVFNTAGDAILVEFDYVFNAVHCAVEIQKELRAINLGQPEERRVLFRMGLNTGEVFTQGGDLLGDAVNIAARIQTSAKPGGICISGPIHDLIANKVSHSFTSLGKVAYKNIPEPIRTYALTEDDGKFKPPLPSLKATPFEAPNLAKATQRNKTKLTGNGSRNLWLLALPVAATAFFLWLRLPADHAAPSPPAAAIAPAQAAQTVPLVPAQPAEKKPETAAGPFQGAGSPGSSSSGSLEIQQQIASQITDSESAYRKGMEALSRKEFEAAYANLARAVKITDHNPAQYELGKLYYSGNGAPKDMDASLYWLLKSAEGNVHEATTFLAAHKDDYKGYAGDILKQQRVDSNDSKKQLYINSRTNLVARLADILEGKNIPH